MVKAESQYLELWENNKEQFSSGSNELLNFYRSIAAESLKEKGIPKYRSENYQRTDLEAVFQKDWGIDIRKSKYNCNPKNNSNCDLPAENTIHFTMVNNTLVRKEDYTEDTNVFIGTLSEFALKYPKIVEKYYAQIAKPNHDGLVALNTMLIQDVFIVYVPKNVKLNKTIQLLNVINSVENQMINRRLLVILEDGAKAMMLSCDSMTRNVETLSLNVVEIYAGNNSEFDLTILEETLDKCKNISSIHTNLEGKSKVVINGLTLSNGMSRNNYYCDFKEKDSHMTLSGLAIGSGNQHIDNYSFINHSIGNCRCDELFKYVLSDKSYGVFTGRIYVAKDSQKTEAYQNNRNLLLSENARMQSKPQLEIYADDVKCSHGMTTGQLDEDALFYMRQRGISKQEAKLLLSIAFTEDVIKTISLDSLQERVRSIVDARFRSSETIHCGCKCHEN